VEGTVEARDPGWLLLVHDELAELEEVARCESLGEVVGDILSLVLMYGTVIG